MEVHSRNFSMIEIHDQSDIQKWNNRCWRPLLAISFEDLADLRYSLAVSRTRDSSSEDTERGSARRVAAKCDLQAWRTKINDWIKGVRRNR